MAAKAGFKDLLLQKGEKFALFAALGLFGLFVVWGLVGAAGAGNPEKLSKDIDTGVASVQSKINDPSGKPEDLPTFARPDSKSSDFTLVSSADYRHLGKPFEPIELPSTRREQPRVFTPIESQINYFNASYKAFDREFLFEDNGDVKSVKVGVLTSATTKDTDHARLQEIHKGTLGKIVKKGPTGRKPAVPPKPPGAPGGGSPPPPMGPGGGGVPPPGSVSPPPMGSGAGMPGMPGMPGMAGGTGGNRSESKVSYMSIEEATKQNLPPAVAVYPIRMAVIQMSFPLREQLEEIKQALRLRNLWEARQESSPATIAARSGAPAGGAAVPAVPGGNAALAALDADLAPAFVGLAVEKMVIPPEGLAANLTKEQYEALWAPLDHQERFFSLFTRYDAPFVKEEGYKPYFLRPEQGISAPLPLLADGFALNYPPDTTMGSIYANFKKLDDSKAQKKTADEQKKRFDRGSTNPYAAAPAAAGSLPGGFGGEDLGMRMSSSGGFRPPMGGMMPKPPGAPAGTEGEAPGTPAGSQSNGDKLDVDHLLMRFLDVDVIPGYSYQYRVKVLMKSPNYKNTDKLADDNMAKVEVLESAWYDIPQRLTVPQESFLYAYPVKKYEEAITKIYEDSGKADPVRKVAELQEVKEGKRAVIQVQQWLDRLRIGTKQEPLGAFVQAEMPVAVGEFVGRRVPVELPLWRSAALNYVLPQGDTKSPIYPNWPKDTNNNKYTLPKMRVLDFRTKNVLVDFEGGHTNTKVGTLTLSDDSASDLLIVREDGKIEVRSESLDMADSPGSVATARKQREDAWNEWLKRIRQLKDTEPAAGGSGSGFGSGRPGGEGTEK